MLRAAPPDILLTNYKMLDYLLVRPRDARLWRLNEPDTLRYLVVDELHTFDGAQGADLACLIRRIKERVKTPPGHFAAWVRRPRLAREARRTWQRMPGSSSASLSMRTASSANRC